MAGLGRLKAARAVRPGIGRVWPRSARTAPVIRVLDRFDVQPGRCPGTEVHHFVGFAARRGGACECRSAGRAFVRRPLLAFGLVPGGFGREGAPCPGLGAVGSACGRPVSVGLAGSWTLFVRLCTERFGAVRSSRGWAIFTGRARAKSRWRAGAAVVFLPGWSTGRPVCRTVARTGGTR
jgi:hypothetical protein